MPWTSWHLDPADAVIEKYLCLKIFPSVVCYTMPAYGWCTIWIKDDMVMAKWNLALRTLHLIWLNGITTKWWHLLWVLWEGPLNCCPSWFWCLLCSLTSLDLELIWENQVAECSLTCLSLEAESSLTALKTLKINQQGIMKSSIFSLPIIFGKHQGSSLNRKCLFLHHVLYRESVV